MKIQAFAQRDGPILKLLEQQSCWLVVVGTSTLIAGFVNRVLEDRMKDLTNGKQYNRLVALAHQGKSAFVEDRKTSLTGGKPIISRNDGTISLRSTL